MVVALLTAGGVGSRMNQEIPKQFLTVKNKPIIVYTLEAFQNHPGVDKIIVSCLKGWEEILKAYAKQYGITKLSWVVESTITPQKSIMNALSILKENCPSDTTVLIHDGNRCLVDSDIISDAIVTCENYGNAIACIPCTEVILEMNDAESSVNFLNRDNLKRTQTPHAYPLEKIYLAYLEAEKRNLSSVASCDLMIKLGEKLYFSKGNPKNIKITTIEDIDMFEAFLAKDNSLDGCIR